LFHRSEGDAKMIQAIARRLQNTHQFFRCQLLYPLLLSSALAVCLLGARIWYTHRVTFFFLSWNLFLAWIPYLCSLWITSLHQRAPLRWWLLILPGIPWLLFLPNAPYIVTDFLHLQERPLVPFWFDIGLLATFAWTGCFLAFASIRAMQDVVQDFLGRWASWFFVLSTMALSGVGIYLGRFMNWNSWDLILRPRAVLSNLVDLFAHPLRNPQPFGVTMLFAAVLLVFYLTLASIETRQPASSEKGN
jgi:uncharacterized membrane protein